MKRLTFYLLAIFSIATLSFCIGCGDDDESEHTSPQIKLNLNFAPSQDVTDVKIKVTGEGIDEPIIESLAINGRKATGLLAVPPGNDREFTLEVYENNELTLRGTKKMDIPESGSIVLTMAIPVIVGSPSVSADGDVVIEFNTPVDPDSLDKIKVDGLTVQVTADGKTVIWKSAGLLGGEHIIEFTGVRSADGTEASIPKEISFTAEAKPDNPEIDLTEMVLIPAGEFEMGDAQGSGNEKPVHTVYLDEFYIDKYEVTVGQYKKFIEDTGHRAPNWDQVSQYSSTDQHPMIYVSWHDAAAYAQWAGKKLPTEAQWEKAARGGLDGKKYPWGDDITHDDANYDGTGGEDEWDYCAPVGSFPTNDYSLYDMAGNVWEWCADEYAANYYSNSPEDNPTGPGEPVLFVSDYFTNVKTPRVVRGGSWDDDDGTLRCAYRSNDVPTPFMDRNLGFRCCRSR